MYFRLLYTVPLLKVGKIISVAWRRAWDLTKPATANAIPGDQAVTGSTVPYRIKSRFFSHFLIVRHPAALTESTSLYLFVVCPIVIEDMAKIDAEHLIPLVQARPVYTFGQVS